MNTIYLNEADGRKPKKLTDVNIDESVEELCLTLKERLVSLWSNEVKDIHIDQNISTHIAYIIDIVSKKHKSISVYLDSHEVFWIKDNIEKGELSLGDMSYPNYAPPHQYISRPHKVTVFDPEKELDIVQDGSIPIIIYTHASRLTGQIFPLEIIFKNIKEKHPNAVCIADGAQIIGAEKIYHLDYTDAYFASTSKFIGAEPHLGLCLLSDKFKALYLKKGISYPLVDVGVYKKELYSANEALKDFVGVDFESYIKDMRACLLEKISEEKHSSYVYDVKDQASHIVTLRVGDKSFTKSFVESLEKLYNISVSHNMNFSLVEPEIPLVRVSVSIRCTKEYIDALVLACGAVLENTPHTSKLAQGA